MLDTMLLTLAKVMGILDTILLTVAKVMEVLDTTFSTVMKAMGMLVLGHFLAWAESHCGVGHCFVHCQGNLGYSLCPPPPSTSNLPIFMAVWMEAPVIWGADKT